MPRGMKSMLATSKQVRAGGEVEEELRTRVVVPAGYEKEYRELDSYYFGKEVSSGRALPDGVTYELVESKSAK